jgi:Flp pilus assembly protein TadD
MLGLIALFMSACAQMGDIAPSGLLSSSPDKTAVAETSSTEGSQTELQKATEYWGREHAKSPRDADVALKYVRNLKALGAKQQALAVLQQAYTHNSQHRELISEYGRLALDLDQAQLAITLLAAADDPAKPDWRVLSARGAAHAKQGNTKEAIPFLERALSMAPDQMSVINNLALAYAVDGQAPKAEAMLRPVLASTGNPKVRQNLIIVLSVQGKFDEARGLAGEDPSPAIATANVDLLRTIAKAEPRASTPASLAPPTSVARSGPARAPALAPVAAAPAVAGWTASTESTR